MSQSSGSPGRGDVTWPEGDPWSDPAGSDPAGPPPGGWPPAGGRPPPPADRGHRPRRVSTLAVVATAVLGLLLGVGIALAATRGPSGQPSAAGSATTPSAGPSTPSGALPSGAPSTGPGGTSGGLAPGGSSGALPGSSSGGSGFRMLFLGQVTALSSSSITLSAQGHTVTAALTRSSKVTGHLKVGDSVSAQIGQAGSRYVVTAIQDPPSVP
jgi:hypothetical protein